MIHLPRHITYSAPRYRHLFVCRCGGVLSVPNVASEASIDRTLPRFLSRHRDCALPDTVQ